MKMDRRALLARGGLVIAGLASFRWAAGASAAKEPFAVRHSPAEWRRILGPQRYRILREAGTERAFTSPLNGEHRAGVFFCAGCAQALFASATKFDSGTGWPSFWRPLPRVVITRRDSSMFMMRTEVLCSRCGSHLGHVFDDGPKPTGLRYCMNGLALLFRPA